MVARSRSARSTGWFMRCADDDADRAIEDCELPATRRRDRPPGMLCSRRMRASGLDLEVEWEGERRVLGPHVGRASYRILQEALTSMHGAALAARRWWCATFSRKWSSRSRTRSPTAASGPERFGLTGMRERVGLLGGDLGVVADDGRFRVKRCLYDRTFDPRAHFDALRGVPASEHAKR